jgi:IS5 family transposase
LQILAIVNAMLVANGLLLKSGTVVDATLIAAPSSTKNSSVERDPEMHQTKKGNQWHFGMKAHIGVDAD